METQNPFLLDEVRCGFLVPSAMKQAWAAEQEVLKEIDRVCKKHNIQYFADWGTLLGAVRHGGFIPWDDDLDIVMKRKDYEKFMSIARFDLEQGFDVQTFRNQNDFWLFMGKVVGKNRFCFEKEHLRRFHNFPYIACVDIFVLDYMYKDPEKEEERRYLCKYLIGVADAIVEGRLTAAQKDENLKRIRQMLGIEIPGIADSVEMGRYLYAQVEKLFARVPEQEADLLTQLFPWGLKGDAFYFPKEYYELSVRLPFEDTTIPVPYAYDRMLRMRYGDYTKIVRDAGAHNYPFFEGQKKNLQKVLDFPLPQFSFQKEMLYRSQEETERKEYSYKAMAKACAEELWDMQRQLTEAQTIPSRILKLLLDSQQLAVDLGTMLEQMLGEQTKVVPLLERYCEVLYQIYEQIISSSPWEVKTEVCRQQEQEAEQMQELEQLQEEISAEIERITAQKTVLFFPVLAKDWDTMQPYWQAAVKDASWNTCVVPLSYYYKDYDGSPKELLWEGEDFPSEVMLQDYRLFTPEYLEMLHPEVIIIQNPYDAWNPVVSIASMFYSENIRKYTDELIYVPPFMVEEYTIENQRAYANMKYYVAMPGVVYADRILVQSENMRRLYIRKLTEFAGEETKGLWEQKIRISEITEPEERKVVSTDLTGKVKKKLLYGISLGVYLEDVNMANRKIADNLRIFNTYREQVEVSVCLFPDEAAKWQGLIGNVLHLQLCSPKECRAQEFDAYYGDTMPIVTEFSRAKKPVMIQNVEIVGVEA